MANIRPCESARLLLILLLPFAAAADGFPASPSKGDGDQSWAVEYVVGTEAIVRNRNLQVTVGPEAITAHGLGNAEIFIPSQAILGITVDEFPHRPLVEASPGIPGGGPGPRDVAFSAAFAALTSATFIPGFSAEVLAANLIFFPEAFYLGVTAFVQLGEDLAALNDRFIYVMWKEGGTVRDVLLRLDRRPAPHLLAAIERATGHPWVDLAARRRQLLDALAARDDTGFTVSLDREAVLGPKLLEPGPYRLILVEGREGAGELFIYKGRKADPDDLLSGTAVKIETGVAGSLDAGVTYVEREGATFVETIGRKDQRLRIPPGLPPWQPRRVLYGDGYALRFEAEEGWIALVSRVERGGEPALRFPVLHPTFPVCSGFLYLTPSRIVYDPVNSGKSGHPISVGRGRIRHVGLKRMLGVDYLRIETTEDKHTFRPLYLRSGSQRPSMGLKNGSRADQQLCNFFLEGIADFTSAARRLEEPAEP